MGKTLFNYLFMNKYIADLHIHSRFSRATSKSLGIRKLAAWAQIKGIRVLATGDFTHPAWLKEIKENLVQEENGLLSLKDPPIFRDEVEIDIGEKVLGKEVNFILCSEISSIYKKGGKVRKVHNLIFMPSVERVEEFNHKLARVGNLSADGRPILGLDCEHLLEMVLETDPLAFLIPAHVWTPWFSLFGSNSGFDSLQECFGSLSSEIFALETGLSSDPPMNWLWSALDGLYLVSNSDAHSGEKLAREANIFQGEISYHAIYQALKYKNGNFLGTIEFFPEEGKYHLDGHRKCNVVLHPKEAMQLNNICPVCGRPLTIGVMHRVLELADRERPLQPPEAPSFTSLIPLCEILSEIMGVGPKTKKVRSIYSSLLERFGSEISILMEIDTEELKGASPLLAEGILRMRKGEVKRQPGFDGQYGKIYLFEQKEKKATKAPITRPVRPTFSIIDNNLPGKNKGFYLNEEQKSAVDSSYTPMLVIAGPGTGKTRTLVAKVENLIKREPNAYILVLTFTLAAAQEIIERIGKNRGRIKVCTLHALSYELWEKIKGESPIILPEKEARKIYEGKIEKEKDWERYLYERETLLPLSQPEKHRLYALAKQKMGAVDYTDLLEELKKYLNKTPREKRKGLVNPDYLLIDEIQDISPLQMEIIRLLCKEDTGQGFFGIGDPNQAIYSFRGALTDVVSHLKNLWGDGLKILSLTINYRSSRNIIKFSSPLIRIGTKTRAVSAKEGNIYLYEAPSAEMEAGWIAREIKILMGGTSHMEADIGREGKGLSPGDIAILVRFKGLINPIKKALEKAGIPCSTPEDINFWEDTHIEILIHKIKSILQNPHENIDISKIREMLKHTSSLPHIFWQSENYKKFVKKAQKFLKWKDFFNWINLQREFDTISSRSQKVLLSTLHSSKGLEFKAVFLPALEKNILPFGGIEFLKEGRDVSLSEETIREEERLFYVGLTRAKEYLFLSHARKRSIFGRRVNLSPSPFLKQLPLKMARKIRSQKKKKTRITSLNLLKK